MKQVQKLIGQSEDLLFNAQEMLEEMNSPLLVERIENVLIILGKIYASMEVKE